MKSLITRTTAARLARFKRPDHWSQRRVEEGFAVQAGCVAENNRAIRSKTNLLGCKEFIKINSSSLLTPENITKEFEYQRIDEHLYHKAVHYLKMIVQEEMANYGTTDELLACREILGEVLSKIPDHFRDEPLEMPAPGGWDKEAVHQIKISAGWNDKQDPLQDMVDLHCAEMAKDPILSRAIIAGPVEAEAFADTITGGQGGFLDKIGRSTALDRLHWIEKPEIESWKFNYDPTWVEDNQLMNLWHLVWNYEETDAGLAYRIKESLGDPVVLPGAIHKIDCEIKFDFDGRSPWTKFKSIIRKEFEPLGLWCLGKMTLAIDEFKDAFPFMDHNRFADYGWPASHFARVRLFKKHGEMLGVKRFPFEPNWMFRKRMLKSIRGINQSIQWPAAAHLGRAPLKPLNLAPFFKAVAIMVGLLILSGIAHYCGIATP